MSTDRTTGTNAAVVTRTFDAPAELVWRAWTDPEHFKRWWGPKDFTAPSCEIDLRVGGKYLFCMRDPEGKDLWSTGTYEVIEPMQRLVYSSSFADERGNPVPGSYYGFEEELPLEGHVTITFEERDGRTTLTISHEGLPAGEMREQTAAGWSESLDKLAELLR